MPSEGDAEQAVPVGGGLQRPRVSRQTLGSEKGLQ